MKKSKQSKTKSSKTKLNTIYTGKLLRFLLYYQKMLVNMNFLMIYVLPEKDLLEEAATMKKFKYSSLGKELKAQTDITKKQYQVLNNFFKYDVKREPVTITKYKTSYLDITVNTVFTKIIMIVKKLITFLSNQSTLF